MANPTRTARHLVTVEPARTKQNHRGQSGLWWSVRCSECGPVGVEQEYQADAQAIRDEHDRVQGFSR